jgi:multicomponent Na+:H+ antiporter subunit G
MHAAGKAGTLGVSLVLVAVGIFFVASEPSVPLRAGLAIFFQFLTTPAATHLLARASYVTEYPLSERTAVDELKSYLPSRPNEMYGAE